ncbi:MAG: hypothetical protein R6X13_05430, partial [bacterium]
MKKQAVLCLVMLTVAAGATGWSELRPVPMGSGCRCIKDGAWLAYDSVTGRMYGAKGNKTYDFLAYDPLRDTWHIRTDCPAGDERKPVGNGAAACASDNGVIYATKGNNTTGFHCYLTTQNAWQQLPDVPLGPQAKKCKGGTGVVFVPGGAAGYVYLLKGRVRDFLRYDIASGEWQAMPDAPVGNMFKWDKGSWLAYDGAGTIYAHKAKIHELHRFDVAAGAWLTSVLVGVPHHSPKTGKSRKSKAGAAGVFADGKLHAFKGGNTQEFWRFDPATLAWTELDTLPRAGSSGKKRKVKAGGDLASDGEVIYAFKGAKTNEFWRYDPGAAGETPNPKPQIPGGGVLGRSGIGDRRLEISSNPARGRATIGWSAPSS